MPNKIRSSEALHATATALLAKGASIELCPPLRYDEPMEKQMVDARPVRHPELMRDGDAMKTVRYESTLFYYDGPQVFEARDAIGGHYVAVMVDSGPRSSTALAIGEPRAIAISSPG